MYNSVADIIKKDSKRFSYGLLWHFISEEPFTNIINNKNMHDIIHEQFRDIMTYVATHTNIEDVTKRLVVHLRKRPSIDTTNIDIVSNELLTLFMHPKTTEGSMRKQLMQAGHNLIQAYNLAHLLTFDINVRILRDNLFEDMYVHECIIARYYRDTLHYRLAKTEIEF